MRSSYSVKLLGSALLAVVGAIATLPAGAAPPLVAESAEVRYDDLDLDNAAGVAELYARLHFAAEKVCDFRLRPGTLLVDPRWRTCMSGALGQAVATVDRPALSAYHAANAGRRNARSADRLATADARN
jgi:UrcA family protein